MGCINGCKAECTETHQLHLVGCVFIRIVSGSNTVSTGTELNVPFSGDGRQIVSGSHARTVRVWDVSTGAELNVLEGHTCEVTSVAFSRDSMWIASGSSDKTVQVWDVLTGVKLNVLKGHSDIVTSVVFSGSGMRIVSGSVDMTVWVWNVSTGLELNVLEDPIKLVTSVAFLRDGRHVASGLHDRTVRVWDASMGAKLNVLKHTSCIWSVVFSYALCLAQTLCQQAPSSMSYWHGHLCCIFEGWHSDCVWLD